MPRQHLFKQLDPLGFYVPQLREKVQPLVSDYERLVSKDLVLPDMDISQPAQALNIYRYFHPIVGPIRYMAEWAENEIPFAFSCEVCMDNCVRRCKLLF
jgi:hypothetical protein